MRTVLALVVVTACAPSARVREVSGQASASSCTAASDSVTCTHRTFQLPVAAVGQSRVVHVGLPGGDPPASGWPCVVLFQGSLFSAERTWSATRADAFGAFWQTATVAALLDAGFAVVTPEVRLFGTTAWDTNLPQWSARWSEAPDRHLLVALLDAVGAGELGPLDPRRMYAGGLSSGGYMTSRMALSYPGRFRALAIHSASWATCGGPLCVLPDALPADHPPTLFLHGERDAVVPIGTMRVYEERLRGQGVDVDVVTAPDKGHEWLEAAAGAMPSFFRAR
ncbi:MAG: hypothetical protein JNJ54_24290 [Myxococcaceae bacterium]|nr:hypothetical protein [Myxococcaceae bacterium]